MNGIPLLAVRDNACVLRVDAAAMQLGNLIEVQPYAEAAGLVLARREGIAPSALRRPLGTARRV